MAVYNNGAMMEIGEMMAPRVAFGEALVELGGRNADVVVFDSDFDLCRLLGQACG